MADPEALWSQAQRTGSPVVSPVAPDGTVEVTFLWRGEAESTSVGWGVWLELARVPGTDLWHGSIRLPATARTLYYLSHDGADDLPRDDSGTGPAHLDPLNPRPFRFPADPDDPTDRDAWASLLDLPEATEPAWSTPRRDVPIEEHTLPGGRRVAVYRPPGEPPAAGLATLVLFDGWLGRTVLRVQHTLDNLIAAGRIPPMLGLFVPGVEAERDTELTPASAATTGFVTGELLPWARRELGAGADPARTVVAGQSLGGLMAAHVALSAPEAFGAVIAQSGSFWWPKPEHGEPGRLLRDYAEQPRADLRFYLNVGDRETRNGSAGTPTMRELSRRMRDVLTAKGYPVTYAEYHGAHDYVNWRDTFADGLLAVLRPG
ncbi:alpha/beta hydrolase-fold protein [Actinoplanes sp. NPDC049599]|uniref:alpha/beta hydrolase-fold protein n=1 Tax=Actinoplanes sp. NPDC049599 TaxID=3363903 RepID=UPI0037BBE234